MIHHGATSKQVRAIFIAYSKAVLHMSRATTGGASPQFGYATPPPPPLPPPPSLPSGPT